MRDIQTFRSGQAERTDRGSGGKWAMVAFGAVGLLVAWSGLRNVPAAEAQNAPVLRIMDAAEALARDASTFSEDVSLTNGCVENGADKAECLCVTRVLKYELSLREYTAASRLYALPATGAKRRAVKRDLLGRGYSAAEVTAVDALTRELTHQPDFGLRCAEAAQWFDMASNRPLN